MKFNSSGQTIIEAVVALAAVFAIVAAITIAITNALNNSQFVKNQNLANKYAQQGMEYIRRLQAEDIDTLAILNGEYAFGENDLTLNSNQSNLVNIGNSHIRNVNITTDEAPCLAEDNSVLSLKKVSVIVKWSSGRCDQEDRFCHNTTLVSCIPYERSVNVYP